MTNKYINWIDGENKTWYAYNKDDVPLGKLSYERTGTFMHWCWHQYKNIRMSPGCLQEVRDKQKALNNNAKRLKE